MVQSMDASSTPRPVVVPAPLALTVVEEPSTQLLAIDTPWRAVLETYLRVALDSPATIASYRWSCISGFERMGIRSLTDLTIPLLMAYRADLVAHSGLAPASQALRLYALRSFLDWSGALGAHHLDDRAIRKALRPVKATVRQPYRVLKADSAQRLWEVAAERPVTYALLCVCLGSGLRVSEISNLRVRDCYLDLEGGPALYVHQGKGKKDRTVPMRAEFFQGIVNYLEATGRSLDSPGRVFLAQDHCTGPTSTGMTPAGLRHVLRQAVEGAGMNAYRFNVHALRHSYAIGALRHSHDVVAVKKLLGHASITTTARYVDHLELADLRDALPSSAPPAPPPPPSAKCGLTATEAAAILGLSDVYVGYLCDKGTLVDVSDRTKRTSRDRQITPESVEALRVARSSPDYHSRGWNMKGRA